MRSTPRSAVQGRPDWFTLAYFHTPDARRTEITQAGFAGTRIVAIEGLGATADLDDDLEDTARRATIMRALERVESEPSVLEQAHTSGQLAVRRRTPSWGTA